ncbi:MAG: serine/threonine-protein kinase [Planctomycetota bacterium]|nr:serine/threonine-protein kinase [Planctomycetota bacterium]
MPNPTHETIGRIFLAACDLPEEEHDAYLDTACGADDSLKAEVKAMLQAEKDQPNGLDRASIKIDLQAIAQEEDTPKTIGPYSIKRKLGVGGMGIVYEAQQEKPTRSVALKVLRWVDDPAQRARFELEAEVLGWLQHPSIAHIYDTGQSNLPGGPRPWIAMEYVDGIPLDQYVHEHSLDVRAILQLVERILGGIAHAHSKGVVHRDLKPANILVDPSGSPRIVDFGVARLAAKEKSAVQTRAGEVFGTLAYMSPEQVGGDPAEVGTQSDIYAMGIITYELISGKHAIVPNGASITEAMRAIGEAKPRSLNKYPNVSQDLNTVVQTAMARDKINRYATADAFSEDIRRLLAKEVILARPPSALYQLRCFGRRNRLASFAIAAALILLVGGGGLSTYLYLKEQEASLAKDAALKVVDQANTEILKQANFAERGLQFYGNLISKTHTSIQGSKITLSDQLENASLQVPRLFDQAPALQVEFLKSFANAHYGAGRLDLALNDIESAVRLIEQHPSAKATAVHSTYLTYSLILGQLGRRDEALSAAIRAKESVASPTTPELAFCYAQACERLAIAYTKLGDFETSLTALQPAFEAMKTLEPSDHLLDFPGRILKTKAVALAGMGRDPEAAAAMREAIAYIESADLTNTPQWVDAKYFLAKYLIRLGQYSNALPELTPLPPIEESLNGDGYRLFRVLKLLGECHVSEGNHRKTIEVLEVALQCDGEREFDTPFQRHEMLYDLARAYSSTGDSDAAYTTFKSAAEAVSDGTDRNSHVARFNAYSLLSQTARAQGERGLSAEYANLARLAIDTCPPPALAPNLRVFASRYQAIVHTDSEQWIDAANLFLRAVELSIELESAADPEVLELRSTMATECAMALSQLDNPPEEIQSKLDALTTEHQIKLRAFNYK